MLQSAKVLLFLSSFLSRDNINVKSLLTTSEPPPLSLEELKAQTTSQLRSKFNLALSNIISTRLDLLS